MRGDKYPLLQSQALRLLKDYMQDPLNIWHEQMEQVCKIPLSRSHPHLKRLLIWCCCFEIPRHRHFLLRHHRMIPAFAQLQLRKRTPYMTALFWNPLTLEEVDSFPTSRKQNCLTRLFLCPSVPTEVNLSTDSWILIASSKPNNVVLHTQLLVVSHLATSHEPSTTIEVFSKLLLRTYGISRT